MAHNLAETSTTYPANVVVPDDGDPRNAASVETPFNQLNERARFLYRILSGAAAAAAGAVIEFAGAGFKVSGTVAELAATTNYMGNSGGSSTNTIRGAVNATGLVTAGAGLTSTAGTTNLGTTAVSGATGLSVSGGGSLGVTGGNLTVNTGNLVATNACVMSGSWQRLWRVSYGVDSNQTLNVATTDEYVVLSGLTAGRTITLSKTNAQAGHKLRISMLQGSQTLTVLNGAAGPTLNPMINTSANIRLAEYTYDGADWIMTSYTTVP